MRIRRTGAKAGVSPVWYIQASTEEEKAAIRAGLLKEKGPLPARWPYVLAWGLRSRAAAAEAMEELQTTVAAAIEEMQAQSLAFSEGRSSESSGLQGFGE